MSCHWLISTGIAVSFFMGLLTPPSASAATPIKSFAIVQDDGSLKVKGRSIRLFGVHIPRTAEDAAVRALNRSIRGFVTCHPQGQFSDRSLSAVCYVEHGSIIDPPLDLGALLIEHGLAVAGPDAPFDYVTLERIAKSKGRGVWRFDFH